MNTQNDKKLPILAPSCPIFCLKRDEQTKEVTFTRELIEDVIFEEGYWFVKVKGESDTLYQYESSAFLTDLGAMVRANYLNEVYQLKRILNKEKENERIFLFK